MLCCSAVPTLQHAPLPVNPFPAPPSSPSSLTFIHQCILTRQWHVYEAKAAERASQLAEQRVSAAELLHASEARFAASPQRQSQQSASERSAGLSRILRSGQRIDHAADVLGVKHPRDTRAQSTDAETLIDSSFPGAGPRASWTVTAQHVSAVLAAGKRVVPDRPSAGGSGSPSKAQPVRSSQSKLRDSITGSSTQQSSDSMHRGRHSPPSAESVRPPLQETQPGGRQRRDSSTSVDAKAPTRFTNQMEGLRAPPLRPIAPAAMRDTGRRSTGVDRPAGMRDAGPPSGAGAGAASYAAQHAAREAAAAAAARVELDAVTAELEAARGQLAEALRATQAERDRAQEEREAALVEIERERAAQRNLLQVSMARSMYFWCLSEATAFGS